jgi:hypothetical protein
MGKLLASFTDDRRIFCKKPLNTCDLKAHPVACNNNKYKKGALFYHILDDEVIAFSRMFP